MNLMQELFDHVRVAHKELEEQGPAERKTFRGEPFGVYTSREELQEKFATVKITRLQLMMMLLFVRMT